MSELRSIPYFIDLSEAELQDVASLIGELRHARGEILFLEGGECQGLYVVKSGRIRIFKTSPDGKEQVLRIMEKGESFNEVPIFDGGA